MSYNPLPEDISGNVLTAIGKSQTDVVGAIVVGERNNTVIASFSNNNTNNINDLINITASGSSAASMSNGSAIFSSGTNTTSSLSAVTYTSVNYNPGFEVYVTFSISFTTPTSANSTQFIGLWDIVKDGFYIGYNGTTFGIASMYNGTQTFVQRSSWNGDLLDGSSTSKFTRNGMPESINLTYLNLFRIRFSWWGSAPIVYEVLTPDGEWIIFHTIRQPNTTVNPSLTTPNLPISLSITKASADSTDLIMKGGSFAAGTTSPLAVDVVNFVESKWTSLTPLNTSTETTALGSGSATISIVNAGSVTSGTAVIEATIEGTQWFVLKYVPVTGDLGTYFSSHNFILGNMMTQISTSGYLKVRVRLSSVILGTGSVDVSIRPSIADTSRLVQVYQTEGTNLHAVIDSGTVSTTSFSSTGNAPSSVPVGVTSTSVLSANSSRKGLVLTNTSNRVISLGLNGVPAVLNSGITLQPGGIWVMDSYTFTTGAITAIASGAASNLAIQEFQ